MPRRRTRRTQQRTASSSSPIAWTLAGSHPNGRSVNRPGLRTPSPGLPLRLRRMAFMQRASRAASQPATRGRREAGLQAMASHDGSRSQRSGGNPEADQGGGEHHPESGGTTGITKPVRRVVGVPQAELGDEDRYWDECEPRPTSQGDDRDGDWQHQEGDQRWKLGGVSQHEANGTVHTRSLSSDRTGNLTVTTPV